MLDLFRPWLLRFTLARAFAAVGRPFEGVSVVGAAEAKRLDAPATQGRVVTVAAGTLFSEVAYSEPGNPILRTVHPSVADLVLSLLSEGLNTQVRLASTMFAYQPDQAPTPEIRAYLKGALERGAAPMALAHVQAGLAVAGALATLAHRRLDAFLDSPWLALADRILFGGDPWPPARRMTQLRGHWSGAGKSWRVGEAAIAELDDSGAMLRNATYGVLRVVNRVCLVRVEAPGELPYVLRACQGADGSVLVLHGHEGRVALRRVAKG